MSETAETIREVVSAKELTVMSRRGFEGAQQSVLLKLHGFVQVTANKCTN